MNELQPTQKHLLKLLLEIDQICKKYSIEYFLDYGTLLGAIRHEGFIPWDDDVDITMTENNYDKWVEACKKELDPHKRVFKDGLIDRNWPSVFGRYNDVETMRLSDRSEFWEPVCGQCIDIFCLLELPGDPIEKQKAVDRYYAYDEYSNTSYMHCRSKTDECMKLINQYLKIEKIVGREKVLRHLEKKIFHQHYDDCDTYIVDSARSKAGPCPVVPKSYYDTVYMANFEGYKLPVPGKYFELLTLYYGDAFYCLPKEKKKHFQMSLSGIRCEDYVDDYMRYTDKKKLLSDRREYKFIDVEEGYRETHYRRSFLEQIGKYEALKIRKTIKEEDININELLDASDNGKLGILDQLFNEYFDKQLHHSTYYWDVYFDIGDDLLYAALYVLVNYRHDFYSAYKIIELREKNGLATEGNIKGIKDLILISRNINASLQYGNIKEADCILKDYMNKFPYSKELRISRFVIDVSMASNENDYAKCEEAGHKLLEEYPENDQCMKTLGDIAYFRHDSDKMNYYYDWLTKHSANGMILLDIKKKRENYCDKNTR